MGTIADKLDYLTGTKELFKDRLNSLGAEITSSTTFRNYLTWLDTFYNNVSDKTDLSVNGVVGRTSQNTAILPSEYTQVDYIESSGTQYIDTGVNADYKLSIKTEFSNLSQSSYQGSMSGNNSSNRIRHHLQITSTGNVVYWAGLTDSGCSTTIITGSSYDSNKKYNFFADIYNQKYYLDDTEISGNFNSNNFDTELNYYLFGRNTNNVVSNMGLMKMYSCKMYYNNVLARDFIPCYRNSDNEVGLYDLANDTFYTNQGTGAFTYGSVADIPNPDYPQPINNLTGNVAYKITTQNGEQTFTIPLGDIELCDIDTHEDKIYSSNGRFYLEKNINKFILDGSETWGKSNIPGAVYTQRFRTNIGENLISNLAISNKFINRSAGMSAGDYECVLVTNNVNVYISINISRLSANSIEAFENWLSNNNVMVYGVLATPTTTEITQENYPLLYNALKQIQDYLTSYKINKEFILGYSSPEIEY